PHVRAATPARLPASRSSRGAGREGARAEGVRVPAYARFVCKRAARTELERKQLACVLNCPTAMAGATVRVAALGDIHCTKTSQGAFQPLLTRIAESAELLLIAGDLTDYGLPEQARVLAKELATLRIPIVAVLGNHD